MRSGAWSNGLSQGSVNSVVAAVSLWQVPAEIDSSLGAIALQQGLEDLIVTSSMTLTVGTYHYNNVTVTNGSTLFLQGDVASGEGVTVTAYNLTVDTAATISADGLGYGSSAGPGAGAPGGGFGNAGGGGYGGRGGEGSGGVGGGPSDWGP